MGSVTAFPATNPKVFWAEMAPCEHVVQIYGEDDVFLDALEGYIAGALRAQESAIVIGTVLHLHGLEGRLRRQGIDLETEYPNVRRWRDGAMLVRWVATGLQDAQPRFRRIKGCDEMPALIRALDRHQVDTKKAVA